MVQDSAVIAETLDYLNFYKILTTTADAVGVQNLLQDHRRQVCSLSCTLLTDPLTAFMSDTYNECEQTYN